MNSVYPLLRRTFGALTVATCLVTAAAHAEPSAEDKRAAQAAFQEGEKAFKAGDYKLAAERFELAYKTAPHYAPLWNAGRAWHRAGELVRAANTYARYLNEAPANAPDRNKALEGLKELKAKLGALELHATDVEAVKVDGVAVDATTIYVAPGAHVVEGRTTTTTHEAVRVSQNVGAGEMVSVALVPPAATATATTTTTPADPGPKPAPHERSGLSPVFVYVGGALALGAGGFAVWSGLDTNKKRDDYLKGSTNQTQDAYDAGKSAELRTNVAIAVAGGLALVTTALAVFLVDWGGGSDANRVGVGVGPSGLLVRGTF